MPTLTIPNTFVANTKIKSADVNANFTAISTLLNSTKLDSTNVQLNGLTRDRLALGTANALAINDSSGNLSDGGSQYATLLPLIDQSSDPSSPSSGNVKVYSKNKALYLKDSAGIVTAIGSGGSGSGGINYVLNPNFETDISGWMGTAAGTTSTNISTYNATVTITIASPAVLTSNGHGLLVGDRVILTTTGSLPTGLTSGTTYYVSAVLTSDTFKVSATLGGADINTSGSQSGTHTLRPLQPSNRTISLTGGVQTFAQIGSGSQIRGNFSGKLTKTANIAAGEAITYPITLDPADKGKMLTISLDYQAGGTFSFSNGSTSSSSDIEVWAYDVTNGVRIPVSPRVLTDGSTSLPGKFVGEFQTNTNSTSYRLVLHIATNSAAAYSLTIDNVSVGPSAKILASPMTDFSSYNLVIGATTTAPTYGTITINNAQYRRVGDSANIRFDFVQTVGGSAGTGTYLFPLPPGLAVDLNKVKDEGSTYGAAVGAAIVKTGTTAGTGIVGVYDANNLFVTVDAASGSTFSTVATALASTFYGLGGAVELSFEALVPISGWSGSTEMSNDTDTRVVAASATNSTDSTASTTNPINFDTVLYDTHAAITTSATAWKFTAPVAGYYKISGAVTYSSLGGGTNTLLYKNGVFYSFLNTNSTNSVVYGYATEIHLNLGDYVDLRSTNSSTTQGSSAGSVTVAISRVSGPSAIAASETIAMKYYDTSGSSVTGSFGTITLNSKDYDTHNAYSGGVYTVPAPGKYAIKALLVTDATSLATNQSFNLKLLHNGSQSSALQLWGNGTTQNWYALIADTINCNLGDTIALQASCSTVTTLITTANFNLLAIEKVGN